MTDNKAKPAAQGEPSMEEILASIRRIISEDGDAPKPAAAPAAAPAQPTSTPAPQPAPQSESASDVLELTDVVEEVVAPEPAPPAPVAKPVPAPVEVPAPPAPPAAAAPVAIPVASSDDGIVSDSVAAVATGALSNLMSAKRQTERPMSDNPMPLGNPGATLESIVRDEIRPLLKAWLDQNLPAMVERMVQREIQRISRNLE